MIAWCQGLTDKKDQADHCSQQSLCLNNGERAKGGEARFYTFCGLVLFCVFETGSGCVAQPGLGLMMPHLSFPTAGTTGVCHLSSFHTLLTNECQKCILF